ncbi:hypothetical protein Tco_1393268 [Tanacetum coccineum]
MTPRSCLKWKPTSKIFKTVGLRWIPTGKIFESSTTKVGCEPPHGSNTDITNLHECIQTFDSSAGTSINVQEEQNLDLSVGIMPTKIELTLEQSQQGVCNDVLVGPHGTRDLPSRYQDYQDKDCQGRFLASFLDDAKYEHVGQETRSQDGKDDQDKQGKYLKISESNTKSKDNDKGSRSKITKHEVTSLQHNKDQRLKN